MAVSARGMHVNTISTAAAASPPPTISATDHLSRSFALSAHHDSSHVLPPSTGRAWSGVRVGTVSSRSDRYTLLICAGAARRILAASVLVAALLICAHAGAAQDILAVSAVSVAALLISIGSVPAAISRCSMHGRATADATAVAAGSSPMHVSTRRCW